MDSGGLIDRKHRVFVKAAKALSVLIALALFVLWLSGTFMSKVKPGPPQSEPDVPKYTTHRVARRVFPLVAEQAGTVRAYSEMHVSSRITAKVKQVLVEEGDMVTGADRREGKPTVMARLDDSDIRARLSRAQSQVKEAERAIEIANARLVATRAQVQTARSRMEEVSFDFKRFHDHQRSQAAGTPGQLEQARAQRDIAQARLDALLQEVRLTDGEVARAKAHKEHAEASADEIRAALAYTVIHAPFTGRVIEKTVNVGDMASPDEPLFYVETSSHPEFHASVMESLKPYIKVGQDFLVRIDALDRSVSGRVREVEPHSDSAARTLLVKLSLKPDPAFEDGLSGRIQIPQGEYDTLMVPSRAIREEGQLHVVDVLGPDGRATRRIVTIGQSRADDAEILSGLRESEEVILPQ